MTFALVVFIITYASMLAFQKYRPWIALSAAMILTIAGVCGMYPMDWISAITAVDYNVLLMIAGTMGLVTLFVESKMPARMSEMILERVPDVRWAVTVLALMAGIISAFVDNVATVLMMAPIGMAISKRLRISPVPVLISIAVSSNLQGAATLVGDTTSILLGSFAGMNFMDFFWMEGRPGIFWGVELGAIVSAIVLFFLFRKMKQPLPQGEKTVVSDYFPTFLMVLTIILFIIVSFLPSPEDGFWAFIYNLRNGLICCVLCVIGHIRACLRAHNSAPVRRAVKDLDTDTLLLLFGLFIVIEGIRSAGVIDAVADWFYLVAGNNPFVLYTLIVFVSVILSAFIDNIPYVATMLPVVQQIALLMNQGAGMAPYVFYFGLLTGATLGGNLTPIGASANITAIGILRKNGETVRTRDFLRIGVPFTLSAVLCGYVYIWLVWGIA